MTKMDGLSCLSLPYQRLTALLALLFAFSLVRAAGQQTTGKFEGPVAKVGTATHSTENGKSILRVSSDFKIPATAPAPTWRVVDSSGNIFTLDAFRVKGGEKRQVVVPAYVKDISKLQFYCAWAEVLLGEASFERSVVSAPAATNMRTR